MYNNILPSPKPIIQMAKNYLSDINKLNNISPEQLKKYQDKSFKKIVKYAYTVPLYHNKYKKNGIHPNDINGIEDIKKLPIITKDDLRENFPNNIVSKNFKASKNFLISTSGSTGKPVFIYVDLISAIKNLICFTRALREYGGNWNKSKIAVVIDTSRGSIESTTLTSSAFPILQKFFSLQNIKYIDISEKPENIINDLDKFNPEYFGSDPAMLRKLAILKNEGKGKNINPKNISSSSAILDGYTRNYVEKAFNAPIFDNYATTEAGTIAFKCKKCGSYHVYSDLIYLELLDENNNSVSCGKPGHTVLTKLYGQGTPIIRYNGIDDIVTEINTPSKCKINSQMINQIEGRFVDLIVLPDGKPLSPLTLTGIPAKVMKENNSYKIKQFQIIQHKVDEIEVLIVIDKKMRKDGISVNRLLNEIKNNFSEKIGQGVIITVNEVDEIQKSVRSDYFKIAISKVKLKAD